MVGKNPCIDSVWGGNSFALVRWMMLAGRTDKRQMSETLSTDLHEMDGVLCLRQWLVTNTFIHVN